MNRRHLLAMALSAAASPSFAAGDLKIALLGQALIEHDPDPAWHDRALIAAQLRANHVCFTNLETVIKGPRAEAPTRELLTLHAGEPEVIETLKSVGVNLMATANNHAFDLGSGGILDTLAALRAAGVPSAGSGETLARAAAPAYRDTAAGKAALVAFATGKVRDGGMAGAARPGVNEVRQDASGQPNGEDVARVLAAIGEARAAGATVIAYQHNHYWEDDQPRVPVWQRALARRCIDAGAAVFCGHGVPLLQGIETYKGAPIFFGLGNFVFQTEKEPGAYPPESWEGVIAECVFRDSRCLAVKLTPLALNEIGLGGPADIATRGAPNFAKGAQAKVILQRLADRSAPFGSALALADDHATLRLG